MTPEEASSPTGPEPEPAAPVATPPDAAMPVVPSTPLLAAKPLLAATPLVRADPVADSAPPGAVPPTAPPLFGAPAGAPTADSPRAPGTCTVPGVRVPLKRRMSLPCEAAGALAGAAGSAGCSCTAPSAA